jgi:hypothetical protein
MTLHHIPLFVLPKSGLLKRTVLFPDPAKKSTLSLGSTAAWTARTSEL